MFLFLRSTKTQFQITFYYDYCTSNGTHIISKAKNHVEYSILYTFLLFSALLVMVLPTQKSAIFINVITLLYY